MIPAHTSLSYTHLPFQTFTEIQKNVTATYHLKYRRQDYRKTDHSKLFPLHYLIFLNQPLFIFEKAIEGVKGQNESEIRSKKVQRLSAKDPLNHNITPLALAVLFRRKDVIQFLVKEQANLCEQDQFGYTALHYAALENIWEPFLETLKDQKDLENLKSIKDEYRGTFQDLFLLTHLQPSPTNVAKFKQSDGTLLHWTANDFKEKVGLPFRSWYHAPAALLIRFHENQQAIQKYLERIRSPLSQQALELALERFDKNPPELFLVLEEGIGFGIKAADSIDSGEIALYFTGEFLDPTESVKPTKRSQYEYSFTSIDPTQGANLASLINDGPPNLISLSTFPNHGLPFTQVILSIRPIDKEESLFLNYGGGHIVKAGRYILPDPAYNRLKTFFLNRDIKNRPKAESLVEKAYVAEMVNYLIETPYAFIRLHLDGSLKISSTREWLTSKKLGLFPSVFAQFYPELLSVMEKIIQSHQAEKAVLFLHTLSVHTCVEILASVMNQQEAFTEIDMENYRLLGKLYDTLYLFFNGVLAGSLIGLEDASDYKQAPFSPNDTAKEVQLLPLDLKFVFKENVKSYITLSLQTSPQKLPTLIELLNLLET